jgi:NTE family protein
LTRPKLGLALSGGGARGFTHVGVLKVLKAAGISIDCIGGTSMGGVVAAAYASGIPLEEIEALALRMAHKRDLIRLVDPTGHRRGLLRGDRVRDLLAALFLERSFDRLSIPLAIPAVDLVTAQEVCFTSGLLLPAVMATIAVPGIFDPVAVGPYRLVDGGILNNLPVDRVRALGADVVIAVDAQVDPYTEKPWEDGGLVPRLLAPLPAFFLDFYRAELIMIARLTAFHLQDCPPDLLLHPPIPLDITMFLGFPRIPEIIAAGEAAARAALPEIERLLAGDSPQRG